ncbi:hypothetical protein BKA62DRAFT_151446 [Auriculariales sp. MPI-PUGE-AT-0066]|nr:hypothetical protein BKA62DRAFT_151446 [Auriculariales sp. MPI-PUGE-AT-0066]
MTETQSAHYKEVLNRSHKILLEEQVVAENTAAPSTAASATTSASGTPAPDELPAKWVRKKRASWPTDAPPTTESRAKEKKRELHGGGGDLINNVLMDLRKAAAHPASFRMIFGGSMLRDMAKACKEEEQWKDCRGFQHHDQLGATAFCRTYDAIFISSGDRSHR